MQATTPPLQTLKSRIRAARPLNNVDRLAPMPAEVRDVYSAVVGDGFHFMDRPKVPMHHAFKKLYFSAQREALF